MNNNICASKEKQFANNVSELLNSFLALNNISKNDVIISCVLNENTTPFCDISYNAVIFNNQEMISQWKHYFLTHTIEYKMFLRLIKENNIYEKFKKNCEIQKPLIYDFSFLYSSFIWNKTEEGFKFWVKNSAKWDDFVFIFKKSKKKQI